MSPPITCPPPAPPIPFARTARQPKTAGTQDHRGGQPHRERPKRTARRVPTAPGVGPAEGQLKDTARPDSDLAIASFDTLTAEEITGKLAELSQIELAKIDSHKHAHKNRTTVLNRIASLRGDEPTTTGNPARKQGRHDIRRA